MTTIRRHAIPADSYDPKRPLNDLMGEQLTHFAHIAETFPAEIRAKLPAVPLATESEKASEFIAAVTHALMSGKQGGPVLVSRTVRRARSKTVALAASAEAPKKQKRGKPGTKR